MLSISRVPIVSSFKHLYLTSYNQIYKFSSKVPKSPCALPAIERLPVETKIDNETIEQLEKVSLVEFGNQTGIRVVEEAIRFADQLYSLNTEGVEPLLSVLENRSLFLRDDTVTVKDCKDDILGNCQLLEEGYFVAPQGNIPLKTHQYDINEENA